MKRVALLLGLILISNFLFFKNLSAYTGTLLKTVARKAQSALLPLATTDKAIPAMIGQVIERRMIPYTLGVIFVGQRSANLLTEATVDNAVVKSGNLNQWLKTWQVGETVFVEAETLSFRAIYLDAEEQFLNIMMMLANSGEVDGITNAYYAVFESLLSSTTWAIKRSTTLKTKRISQFASAALFIDKVTDTEVETVLLDENFLAFARKSGLSEEFLAKLRGNNSTTVEDALSYAQIDMSDAFFADRVLAGTEIPVRKTLNELVGDFVSTFFHLLDDLSRSEKRELRVNLEPVIISIANIMHRAGSIDDSLRTWIRENPSELIRLSAKQFNMRAQFPFDFSGRKF